MGELSYSLRGEITALIRAGRGAASLQPDGSKVPSSRCLSIFQELGTMIDPSHSGRLSTVTITYALRILKLVESKVTKESGHVCGRLGEVMWTRLIADACAD